MDANVNITSKKRNFHFAQILPNNDRVRKNELEKLEEEEKERALLEIEKEKKQKEIFSEEIQIKQIKEKEKKQKLKDEENLREDKKDREMKVAKMVYFIYPRKEIYLQY